MKKLIALIFCLTLLGTAARAEYPQEPAKQKVIVPAKPAGEMMMIKKQDSPKKLEGNLQKTVDQKVNNAERKVTLRVYPDSASQASFSKSYTEGEAVIMGTNEQGNLVLLTSKNLAIDINLLGDENFLVKIVDDSKSHVSKVLKIRTAGPSGLLYQITMPAGSFKNFKMLSERRALELLD